MMRSIKLRWILLAAAALLSFRTAHAQWWCPIPRNQHVWGGFYPGSWKTVRVLTENLDPKGNVDGTSTTETKTTLIGVDDQTYTLQIEVTTTVEGKRITDKPRIVKRSFFGDNAGQIVRYQQMGRGQVTLNGMTIPSQVTRIVQGSGAGQLITTVHYSDRVSPHLLRRETSAAVSGGDQTQPVSQLQVLAVGVPYNVLSEVKATSFIRTVHQRQTGKTKTIEVHTPEVPGGVIARSSHELDEKSSIIRRSTLELVDFHVASPPQPPRRPRPRNLLELLRDGFR